MANICENNYTVFGDKDEIVGLAKAIKANEQYNEEYGHQNNLLSNLLKSQGYDAKFIDCARGEFTYLDDKIYQVKVAPGKPETWSLQFDVDSAWCQPNEGIAVLVTHFCKRDPVVYYHSEEPGCAVYESNDPDLLSDDIYSVDVDDCVQGLENRIYQEDELIEAYKKAVPECQSDCLDILEAAVTAKYPENFYGVHVYEEIGLGYGLDPYSSMPEYSGVSLEWEKIKDKGADFER